MDHPSLYIFAEGIEDGTDLTGVRCLANLAHPVWGVFLGIWKDEDEAVINRIMNSLTGSVVILEEFDPTPHVDRAIEALTGSQEFEPMPFGPDAPPPEVPTRIVHRRPGNKAYHALDFLNFVPDDPRVEEVSVLSGGAAMVLYGLDRREDLPGYASDPIFWTSYTYLGPTLEDRIQEAASL